MSELAILVPQSCCRIAEPCQRPFRHGLSVPVFASINYNGIKRKAMGRPHEE